MPHGPCLAPLAVTGSALCMYMCGTRCSVDGNDVQFEMESRRISRSEWRIYELPFTPFYVLIMFTLAMQYFYVKVCLGTVYTELYRCIQARHLTI